MAWWQWLCCIAGGAGLAAVLIAMAVDIIRTPEPITGRGTSFIDTEFAPGIHPEPIDLMDETRTDEER